jgi:thiamine pyrophosphokinase
MEALLVTGGAAPPRSRLADRFSDFDLICAADSGLDTLVLWGLEPDLVVGDMDSLSDPSLLERFSETEVLRARRDKDETDTELGLEALAARGASRIVLAGGGEGRLDHLLAIRCLFEHCGRGLFTHRHRRAREMIRPNEWHTAGEAVFLVEEGTSFSTRVEEGSTVSIFPLAAGASGMSSEGLRWPLSGLSWGPRDFGVSNVAPDGAFSLRAGRGDLLVILLLADSRE